MKNFNLSKWAIEHAALTRYLMVALMVLGIASYFQLGQDEDPPFTFRAMVISAAWPGATAQQMAEQVTDKIERTLQEVPNVDRIRSYSKPGEMLILFQVKDSTRPQEVQQTWYTVRKKIGDMRSTLPRNVQGPVFNDEFGDVYGVIYALDAPDFSSAEVKRMSDDIRQALLHVTDVAKVDQYGVQDEKIYVEISQKRLVQLGLDLNGVLAQLGQQNAVEDAGAIQSTQDAIRLRITGQFDTEEALRLMPIRGSSGQQVKLGDIAQVKRGYVEPATVKMHYQGKNVIGLGVSMAKGGDIIALGKALNEATQRIERSLPAGVQLLKVQDQPQAVSQSVGEFIHVLIEAVVIVLLVSFVALGLHKGGRYGWYVDIRPGLVVAITIPLVLSMTFLAMNYWGIGLHKISLGSLIIALGLLVDDAIIAVEMMVRKMEEGFDKVAAASYAYNVTAMPMLTGTLITATGFLPIGLARSTVGEYTYAIFAVTVIALVLSWWVSVYFVPYLGTLLLKVKHHSPGEITESFDGAFYQKFRFLVTWCVVNRWKAIGITVLIFVMGLVGMSQVQQQFFPDSSRPEILVDLSFVEGTAIAANEAVTQRIEDRLRQEKGVQSLATWIGSGAPRFYLPLDQQFPQSNFSQIIVLPNSLAERETLRLSLPAMLQQEFPEVRARVKLLPNGPPVPYPVQFRVVGPDPKMLRQHADEVKALMRANPTTRGVNDNWNESVKVLNMEIDQAKARTLGVSSQSIAQSLHTLFVGSKVEQFREDNKLIDVVLRQPLNERDAISDINNAYISTASGKLIPAGQILKPVLSWEPGVMWREGREYAITVQCDIVEGLQGATVTQQLMPELLKLQASWAQNSIANYRVEVAGAVEESSKGSSSISAGMPLMLFITFTLLMLQVHSFSRTVLVFLTGPLGIAGVAFALLVLNRPFGFVALLGVIALMGMIQRNSVILIDQIERDREAGVPTWKAIVESAVRRLRPIVLTAAAAVLAMIPLTRSVFWGPMAVAIMGGLIVATVLTLLALPAIYAAWFKVEVPKQGA